MLVSKELVDIWLTMLKVLAEMYSREIIICVFILVEIPTCIIALWEAFTGKSIVDVIWDALSKK